MYGFFITSLLSIQSIHSTSYKRINWPTVPGPELEHDTISFYFALLFSISFSYETSCNFNSDSFPASSLLAFVLPIKAFPTPP